MCKGSSPGDMGLELERGLSWANAHMWVWRGTLGGEFKARRMWRVELCRGQHLRTNEQEPSGNSSQEKKKYPGG